MTLSFPKENIGPGSCTFNQGRLTVCRGCAESFWQGWTWKSLMPGAWHPGYSKLNLQ